MWSTKFVSAPTAPVLIHIWLFRWGIILLSPAPSLHLTLPWRSISFSLSSHLKDKNSRSRRRRERSVLSTAPILLWHGAETLYCLKLWVIVKYWTQLQFRHCRTSCPGSGLIPAPQRLFKQVISLDQAARQAGRQPGSQAASLLWRSGWMTSRCLPFLSEVLKKIMSAGTRWFYKERQKEKHDFNIASWSSTQKKSFRLFMCHITNSQSVKNNKPSSKSSCRGLNGTLTRFYTLPDPVPPLR